MLPGRSDKQQQQQLSRKVSAGQAVSQEEKGASREQRVSGAVPVPPVNIQTTQRGTQRHNRRTEAGSNGVLRTDRTGVGEAVGMGQRYHAPTQPCMSHLFIHI